MIVEIRPRLAFAMILFAAMLVAFSLALVGYANGVMDASLRQARQEAEVLNG